MPLGGHQVTPLVDDGWMYVVDGYGAVYKIDVRDPQKAKIAWIMDPGIPRPRCGYPRTVALPSTRTSSFPSPANGKVLWTKADTGEMVKTVQFDDPTNSYAR